VLASDSALQLVSTDPSGGDRQVIFGGKSESQLLPFPFSAPTWSADGARVAFMGTVRSKDEPFIDIYDAAAHGSGVVKLPGTREGS
jgi:Tol biopolymer transport system component